MNNKIYIIGPTGVGKTTFAGNLSKKNNIKWYELDNIYWDEENDKVRNEEEALSSFKDILKTDSWIIEDVGRDIFKEGRKEADIIYYIKEPRIKSYYKITKRTIRQALGLEIYNCPPSLKEWKSLINTSKLYHNKEQEVLKELEEYKDKLAIISSKEIDNIVRG